MIELSDGAIIILRHFRAKGLRQQVYEYPAVLQALFSHPADCEHAQEELESAGLIELVPGVASQFRFHQGCAERRLRSTVSVSSGTT